MHALLSRTSHLERSQAVNDGTGNTSFAKPGNACSKAAEYRCAYTVLRKNVRARKVSFAVDHDTAAPPSVYPQAKIGRILKSSIESQCEAGS